ncbi:hypothetical protein NN561_017063 [Cricetulus griseus]
MEELRGPGQDSFYIAHRPPSGQSDANTLEDTDTSDTSLDCWQRPRVLTTADWQLMLQEIVTVVVPVPCIRILDEHPGMSLPSVPTQPPSMEKGAFMRFHCNIPPDKMVHSPLGRHTRCVLTYLKPTHLVPSPTGPCWAG